MEKNDIIKIVEELLRGKFRLISQKKLLEFDLLNIALLLKKENGFTVRTLFDIILLNKINEDCDWNIGSLLQHFNYNDTIVCLDSIEKNRRGYLYDSIGLCWSLGECPYKNEKVIEFLYEVIDNGRNSESWWRAAFSLEKITGKDAINNLKRSLKNHFILTLDESLKDLSDKKNVINILLNANSKDIRDTIYPYLKKSFNNTTDEKELLNIIWLFGRLKLYDEEILKKSLEILKTTNSYEMKFYILQAMIDDPKPIYLEYFNMFLDSDDKLIKKMAIVGLGELGFNIDVAKLEEMLLTESDPSVISSLSQAIYKIKNNFFIEQRKFENKYMVNENGLIGDDSDKWYADASIYNLFSEAEDPENICFNIIFSRILREKLHIQNPVDLATGTGRAAKYMLNNVEYSGNLYAVDYSEQMLKYFDRTINRQKYYVKNIELVHSKIEDFRIPKDEKSSFIISSFGFPSKISDKTRCRAELENVFNLLSNDGIFVTLGWDETFNDDLNTMWYKYIPDNIKAANFEEWRLIRESKIQSARNCYLSWYKKNIKVPLLYDTLEEAINVMGHLFGRDAALEVLKSKRTMWWMSAGITWDNKESLAKVLKK